MSMRTFVFATAVCAFAGSAFAIASGEKENAWITGVGSLPGGHPNTSVSDLSVGGNLVIGQGSVDGGAVGFTYTLKGGLESLPDLPGGAISGAARACSADGTQFAGYGVAGPESWEPVRWIGNTIECLGLPAGAISGEASGISDDGSVIVGRARLPESVAFRWTEETGLQAIDALPTESGCRGTAVSGDGNWIAGHCVTVQSHPHNVAFRWSEATGVTEIGDLPGGDQLSTAFDISTDGSVIVGQSDSTAGLEAFRWTEETGIISLGDLPGGEVRSYATGVSRSGAVVVGFGRIAESHSTPFVWDEHHGMQNLEALLANQYDLVLEGWTLGWARRVAVTPRQITFIGEGTNPDGGPEGWVARIPRACNADMTGDLIVDLQDLLVTLGAWGQCDDAACYEDLDDNGVVDAGDINGLIAQWGTCSPW